MHASSGTPAHPSLRAAGVIGRSGRRRHGIVAWEYTTGRAPTVGGPTGSGVTKCRYRWRIGFVAGQQWRRQPYAVAQRGENGTWQCRFGIRQRYQCLARAPRSVRWIANSAGVPEICWSNAALSGLVTRRPQFAGKTSLD